MSLPETLVFLAVALPDERIVHAPPVPLASLVTQRVSNAREMLNWCEIARSLGAAILGMHGQLWIHRDIKLGNVVAQMDNGFLRSLELIDFGTATQFGPASRPPRQVGSTLIGTETYLRPERRSAAYGQSRWRPESAMDEDVYAYASLLGRVLLGPLQRYAHPDEAMSATIEDLVAKMAERGPGDDGPLTEEIGEAFGLVRDLLSTQHRDGIPAISAFLRRVERLRIAALGALARGRWRASRGLRLLPELLGSLEVCAAADDETRWCDRRATLDARASRDAWGEGQSDRGSACAWHGMPAPLIGSGDMHRRR